jgi:preprotein translocase subunit Sss1
METINQKITQLQTNGYELKFEDVFNKAFENYKKIALYAGLAILVLGFVFVFLSAIGAISFLGAEHLNENEIKQFEAKMLKQEYLGYQFIAVLAINSLFSPISAGFLKMAESADKDVEFKMRQFFSFYKWTYFKELFVATFIITFVSTGIDSALAFYKIPVLGAIISFVIGIFTVFSTPLIIFGKQKAITAVKASINLASSQFLTLFLLLLVAFLGSLVGLIGFCIGVLFTVPFNMSMQYAIYDEIIGVENEEALVDDSEDN